MNKKLVYKLFTTNKHHTYENKTDLNMRTILCKKKVNGMPPSLCGKQVVGTSSLPVVVAQSDNRHENRA